MALVGGEKYKSYNKRATCIPFLLDCFLCKGFVSERRMILFVNMDVAAWISILEPQHLRHLLRLAGQKSHVVAGEFPDIFHRGFGVLWWKVIGNLEATL